MKSEIIRKIKLLRDPSSLKLSVYEKYLDDILAYVKRSREEPKLNEKTIDTRWLQQRIMEQVQETDPDKHWDSSIFLKINSLIHEYEEENAQKNI